MLTPYSRDGRPELLRTPSCKVLAVEDERDLVCGIEECAKHIDFHVSENQAVNGSFLDGSGDCTSGVRS